MVSAQYERHDGVLTKMASVMLSIRLPAEDRDLLKRLAVAHTRRAGGLKATTVTDIIRWGIRLVAKELTVEGVGPSIEPTANGAPEAVQAPPEPVAEDVDPVAAIVASVDSPSPTEESTLTAPPVGKPPEESNAPLPDELEDMLKGV